MQCIRPLVSSKMCFNFCLTICLDFFSTPPFYFQTELQSLIMVGEHIDTKIEDLIYLVCFLTSHITHIGPYHLTCHLTEIIGKCAFKVIC